MKKIYTLIAAALLATGAAAQNPTAYFMEGSTFRSQFNPAFAPLRGYVNIPAIGGVNINVGGNIAVDNILFSRDGKLVTLLDSSVSAADALSGLKQNNLLGAFTKNHKNFWSFDLNVRVNEDANLPYSLFEFIKLGKEGQIRNFGTSTDSYLEAAFSYSFPLMDDRLYIGIRGKFLAGLEYEVWRHKIGIGLLYTARVWKYKTMHNITGSVNFHPVRWFTVSGSYSVIDNRGGAVGLALNLCPNWINFYLATDVLTSKHTPQWVPIKQSSMNVTLGLGIPIGKRSHRIAAYVREGDRR